MLFFVSEARCASDTTRKKLYLFSISVAIFFTGVEAIPSIIAILLNKTRISDYLTYNILLCSVFIYLIARAAIMMSSHITDAEEEPQNELEEENDSESANLPEAENDDNKETTDLQEGI